MRLPTFIAVLAAALWCAAPAAHAVGSLDGMTVALDPGHNAGNGGASSTINRLVPIGKGQRKACDTTGTATDGGYAEAAYTWDVAVRRRETRRHLLELERSQWLDPEARERAELRSLIDLLTYAGREVPYYRECLTAAP